MPIGFGRIATLFIVLTVKSVFLCRRIADSVRLFSVIPGGLMSEKKYKKEDCIILLQNKYKELQAEGISRYPQRSDFEDREVVAIKAFLGPWPRALEAAGIKPPRDDDRPQRNKEKRIRAKQARIAVLRKMECERKKQSR